MKNVNVPVGISDFREIKEGNYYYIDKTGLIEEILRTPGTKVTLFTRPRRVGAVAAAPFTGEGLVFPGVSLAVSLRGAGIAAGAVRAFWGDCV